MTTISKIKQKGSTEVYDIIDRMSNYTAFEVLANDEELSIETSVGTYTVAVGMEHRFTMRSASKTKEELDIIVDWGDGTDTKISEDVVLSFEYSEEDSESTISVSHIYEAPGKYIVKILGSKYFAFSRWKGASNTETKQYNLLCRIFDGDLPVATNVTNLASAASMAPRLNKVNIPAYYNLAQIENLSYLFYASPVTEVLGLANRLSSVATASNIFDNCTYLVNTDFMLPHVTSRGTYRKSFAKCKNLTTPASSMFFAGGIASPEVNVEQLFYGCSSLPAEDLSEYFWGNKNIKWLNTENAFSGCSDELRALVPTSWGGTSTSEEAKLQIQDENYYTAFEVYPTSEDIAAGTVDDVTGLAYTNSVTAQMTAKFNIRTTCPNEKLDIVVSWGDGHYDCLKNGDYEAVSSSGYTYTMAHEYQTAGRHIVKIYGKQYFALATSPSDISEYSLMSRCLDNDLPIAEHLTNLSAFCANAKRLLKVDCPFSRMMFRIINTSSMFANCSNLIQATGFGSYVSPAMLSCSWMFQNCTSMSECDFILPSYFSDVWGIKGTFAHCKSLAVDINSLLPPQGFHVKEPNVIQLFINVPLTGTVPVEKLFGDPDITWVADTTTFRGCPEGILSQVPTAWGGSADDSLIATPYQEQISALIGRIEALENA